MKHLLLILLTALPAGRFSALAEDAWFTRSLVGMEIGPTGAQFGFSDTNDSRYCARFDGREIVRHAVAAHSAAAIRRARPIGSSR